MDGIFSVKIILPLPDYIVPANGCRLFIFCWLDCRTGKSPCFE